MLDLPPERRRIPFWPLESSPRPSPPPEEGEVVGTELEGVGTTVGNEAKEGFPWRLALSSCRGKPGWPRDQGEEGGSAGGTEGCRPPAREGRRVL